jgi:ankyrin repeat protein
MRVRPVVVRWSVAGVLAATTAPAATAPGTYWQERACSKDYRWCAEWVRLRGDGRLEVRCEWRGDRASKASDDGNRQIYLTDEAGRRYDHVATSGAAAYGAPDRPHELRPEPVGGSYFFPAPKASARVFALHDEADGRIVPRITLDPARLTSAARTEALLGRIRRAGVLTYRRAWDHGAAPARRTIRLERRADGYAGASRVMGGEAAAESVPVALSGPQAARVLELLATSPLFEGPPERTLPALDEQVDFELEATVGAQRFVFATFSGSPSHAPWSLRADGRAYVLPSTHPTRAFRLIEAIADGKEPPEDPATDDAPPHRLRIAAQQGRVDEVRQLLRAGDDSGARTPYDGETALTAAARWGQTESVVALLAGGADAARTNADGWTALELASAGGHVEAVRALAARGGAASAPGALESAARAGSMGSVRVLLATGAVPPQGSGPALVEAALEGSVEMVRQLLDAGAPVEATGRQGVRPLEGAVRHGHVDVVRLLLAAGASVAADAAGCTPLYEAASIGHADVVELLLAAGSDVHAACGSSRFTALHLAQEPAVAAALLRAGARVDARNVAGTTSLAHLALRGRGHPAYPPHPRREPLHGEPVATARLLLAAGADVNARDAAGITPLLMATDHLAHPENVALALLLLEGGADPNARDAQGRTVLWQVIEQAERSAVPAVSSPMTPLLEALLRAGTRAVPNREGLSPAAYARRWRPLEPLVPLIERFAP